MLLAGADSIREVIAFPKTGGGFDPLTGAPAPITAEQRKEAGVDAPPAPAARPASTDRVGAERVLWSPRGPRQAYPTGVRDAAIDSSQVRAAVAVCAARRRGAGRTRPGR